MDGAESFGFFGYAQNDRFSAPHKTQLTVSGGAEYRGLSTAAHMKP